MFFNERLILRLRTSELDELKNIVDKSDELETVSHAARTAIIQFLSSYEYGKSKFDKAAAKLEQYKKDKIGKI